ncbi:MAG: hypothetical protein L3J71_14255 [Victivallaceae bacterium]|nr:hypothetical protein [Victivallaceae bacterium]
MHFSIYICLVLFCSILFSALLGNYGIALPLPAAVIFYLAIVYGWRIGAVTAAGTGVIIELLYGSSALTPLALLLVMIIAQLWLHYYDTKNISALIVPGAVTGVILFLPQLMFYQGSWLSMLYLIPELLFSIIIMICIMPLTVYLLDKLSKSTGLLLFKDAKIKLIHQKR